MSDLIERKTLFIYPNLETLTDIERDITVDLITDISLIITVVNNDLSQLIRMGCFFKTSCKPTVEITEIDHDDTTNIDVKNVRICINKYGNTEYDAHYDNVVNSYQRNLDDISHLIGLNILSDPSCKPKFIIDPNNRFDVIIETGLDKLYSVLLSIILDIYLYHYFGLSSNLSDRKLFSILKVEYLKKQDTNNFPKIYGCSPEHLNNIKYLPFSLEEIFKLNRRKNVDSKKKALNEVIAKYHTMLLDILPQKIKVNENCSIVDADTLNLSNSHSTYIDKYLSEQNRLLSIKEGNDIIMLDENLDSTISPVDSNNRSVLQLKNHDLNTWLNTVGDDLKGYKIYRFTYEEN